MTIQKRSGSVPILKISASSGLSEWLYTHQVSLGFTSRPAGKFFLAGLDQDRKLSIFERSFDHVSSVTAVGDTLFISTLFQIWRLNNTLVSGQSHNGYDRVYLPQTAHTTGDCDICDMAVDANGRLIFVNTRFSCLAMLSAAHSFKPVWKPDFITALLPEDRCHLSGMALSKDGNIQYATAFSVADNKKGWQGNDLNQGVLIDVATQKIVSRGLCLPHSPRIHNDKIWLLNSGTGQVGYVDPQAGVFRPAVNCPGFLRGLVFLDHYAIVTVSVSGGLDISSDLRLAMAVENQQFVPECGILIIDLNTQKIVHRIQIEGAIETLTDVAVLPGCQRPMLVGLKSGRIKDIFSMEPVQMAETPGEIKNPILI